MKKLQLFVIFASIALLSACKMSPTKDTNLYYWGNYSDVVYAYYNQPGDYQKQEEDLRQIIAKAKEKGKQVAPGVYGHLGLLLLKQGKTSEAHSALQTEKSLYPENNAFIQFLQRKK